MPRRYGPGHFTEDPYSQIVSPDGIPAGSRSEHADWVVTTVALGEALVEVPDYARCVHTRAGQEPDAV